jgi:hypothetical protein
MKSSTSPVRISASGRSPKYSTTGRRRIDRLPDRELLCEDVPLLVDLRELPQRQRHRLSRHLDAALVERAVPDGVLQIVEHRFCFGLRLELAIGPPSPG